MSIDETSPTIKDALIAGRQAVVILESLPADEEHGYDKDEEAAQFEATGLLVEAFRNLDQALLRDTKLLRHIERDQ